MATSEGKNYKLNCLIEGEEDTIIFVISCEAMVKDLKQLIYQEGELEALQCRLLDLALWKVCKEFHMIINIHCLANPLVSQVDIDLEPFQGPIELKFEDLQGVRLSNSGQLLSNLWREQPPLQHLHIFARVRGRGGKPATFPSSFQESACYSPSYVNPRSFLRRSS
jgi:hypothetical protein